jgi:formamidopyrimidine-DNA glycosylase
VSAVPELPDVEGFRRTLRATGEGRRIERVEVADSGVLRGVRARRFCREVQGHTFSAPERLGKWLIARTDGELSVLFHFGMTGELVACPPDKPPHRYDRVRFDLSGRRGLRYRDQRKLQGLRLARSDAATARVLAGQGPDAAGLDREGLCALLAGRRATVKAVLMDQSALAGLGNLLADEIAWRARVHPRRRAGSLTGAECRALHTAMRGVLDRSVAAGRVPPLRSWLTGHRDDADPRCPRCGTALRRAAVAGRTTVWCPQCQRENGAGGEAAA